MGPSAVSKARLGARAALDRKAEALSVLDLQGLSGIADYFLIATGRSTPHLRTLGEAIEAALKSEGCLASHREGQAESGWMLLDYGDVVIHLFLPETRAFYALERLWGDAPEVPLEA